ncbi:WD40 repeat-like protein [Wallemia mellicola CBS 633.66]|uniref:WD40 repeat-like protein n=2 Tax=Wallemia mellicola TaxID=1708541 RepID=I4Y626_WALMC|nr:WD40 repeat-like protein [Wallemia mellicola CBS 633.66]TIC08378.1 WD40 repeat-like protein [Wallemia mellicola]EIM19418.1 WD40 repeat-like protein [Wallemia mellicola CBS 633.66]TIC08563.1 WD40 repeat-like protein [Wallemia mellicola]TIC24725.1 WD40 repeat-like protein [Wallemia mellicola]TIC49864.1 WD40 repeat-like protein [Wallemia mellicola]|eukprot:XP_006960568.1 WD40 repeat-like protein [Wallemia mellicola CBS 633.66]
MAGQKRARFQEKQQKKESAPKPNKNIKLSESKAAHGPVSLNISVGSYERLLYGFNLRLNEGKLQFKPLFMFPAHITCIKSVGLSPPPPGSTKGGKWLITGGTDESLKVWDIRKRVEVGSLTGTEGTPLTMSFINHAHLVIGTTHSNIYIFKCGEWELLKSFKAHKGSVDSAAVHPKAGFAMTVGNDRMGQLWRLGKNSNESNKQAGHVGRIAGTKLGMEGRKGNPQVVKFSKSGNIIAILFKKHVELRKTQAFEVLPDLPSLPTSLTTKFNDIGFVKPHKSQGFEDDVEFLAVASEDKRVLLYAVGQPSDEPKEATLIAELVGHQNRVKSVRFGNVADILTAITISSDGFVRAFDLTPLKPSSKQEKLECVSSYDTKGTRLTCLDVASAGYEVDNGEESEEEQENEEEQEEEEEEEEGEEEEE